jgi:hypothetical protein
MTKIGLTQHLDRVNHVVKGKLSKLQAGAKTIGHDIFRFDFSICKFGFLSGLIF